MKFTVQHPETVWLETVVENASNLEQALELGREQIDRGNYIVFDMTQKTDYEKYWVQDETGKEYTNERELTK